MNSKKHLINIFDVLAKVETKGESTLILADCRRSLAGIIQQMPDEEEPEQPAEPEGKNKKGNE